MKIVSLRSPSSHRISPHFFEILSPSLTNVIFEKCFLLTLLRPIILPIVQEMIEELVLTERIETLVPLTYMICFAIAFYGPNAEILGRVKLDLWQYKPILDFGNYMENVFILFVVDLMSLVLNGIILRTTCNINIFKIFQSIQSEFWLIMAVQQAWSLAEVIKFIIHI